MFDKKFVTILSIVVAVIVFGAVAVILNTQKLQLTTLTTTDNSNISQGQPSENNKDNNIENLIPISDEEPIVITSDIDTSDWQIYRDNKYNYSFKFPSDYENKGVYEDIILPLDTEASGLNLVNRKSSIQVSVESRILFPEEGDLFSIFKQRVKKYRYKTYQVDNIILFENDSLEDARIFSTVIKENVLNFTFRNIPIEIVNAILASLRIDK